MKKTILIFYVLLIAITLKSQHTFKLKQDSVKAPELPGGFMPCGFDASYVREMNDQNKKYSASQVNSTGVLICGRFRLTFQDVILGINIGFDDATEGAARMQCACDVATYIQSVFQIPPGDGSYIDILFNQSAWGGIYLAMAAPAISDPAFINGTPGFYGGDLIQHYITGVDPYPGSAYDGFVTVNFAQPFRTCNQPRSCASYDFYSVILHELTHAMGWFSNIKEMPLESTYSPNQYSKIDQYFMYYGDISTGPLTKIVNNSGPGIDPSLNSATIPYLSSKKTWMKGNLMNDNIGNQNFPVFGSPSYYVPGGHPPGTSSHLGDYQIAYHEQGHKAPGFSPEFVMGPGLAMDQVNSQWTPQELRVLHTIGYQFTAAFASANSYVTSNHQPYTTKIFYDESWLLSLYGVEMDLNTITPPDAVINNCGSVAFNLNTDPMVRDADGNTISIYPGSLYNIRGCSNGGNNSNCLSVSGGIITYTPRSNFIGRAQFGLHLYDGKEKGDFMIYTIDVTGCNPCGSNLVVNGDFEESMEVKTITHPNPDNAGQIGYRAQKYPGDYPILTDGVIYSAWNTCITNQADVCVPNVGRFGSYGINPLTIPGCPNFPAIAGTERFYSCRMPLSYFRLCSSPTCNYILEFDIFTNNSLTYTVGFTNNAVIPLAAPVLLKSLVQNISASASWQHVVIPITYCGAPSTFLTFEFGGIETFIDNLNLHVAPVMTPALSVAAANTIANAVCDNSSVTLSATPGNTLCSASYIWQPGNLSGQTVVVSPTTTTVYTVTLNDGCRTATNITTVTLPLPVITAVASPALIRCNIGQQFATLDAGGAVSYTWEPMLTSGSTTTVSPVSTTIYTVTGKDGNGCVNTQTVRVMYDNTNCLCSNCNSAGINSVLNGGTLSNNVFCINADITVNGVAILTSSDFKIAPGVKITVGPSGTLRIRQCHLYSCTYMWQGIVVQNGGKVEIFDSFIEDAIEAINITNNSQTAGVLKVINTIFNKNYIGVSIKNYTLINSAYPFDISTSVFTCRNIPFSVMSFPNAVSVGASATNAEAPLSNPVINNNVYLQTGTAAQLKHPYLAQKSRMGLKLSDVGLTQNAAGVAPNYYEFMIGGNVFDNQGTCIDLYNSNFTASGVTFQNTQNYLTGGIGYGIMAEADQSHQNRLRVTTLAGVANKFIDCNTAINTLNYFDQTISACDFRGTQGSPGNTSVQRAISIKTYKYKLLNISNNAFYNITHNIMFLPWVGNINIQGVNPTFGQYVGSVFINRNTFRKQLVSYPVTYQTVGGAIDLQMYPGTFTQLFDNVATHLIQVDKNNIYNVCMGIHFLLWKNLNQSCNTNLINLDNNSYQSYYPSCGISIDNCTGNLFQSFKLVNNSVTGYGTGNPASSGVKIDAGSYMDVNCNSVSNITNGIEFNFFNTSISFNNNSMTNNQYGLLLNNWGLIGTQGNTGNPQDNQWLGAWSAPNYKTGILNNSDATNSPLYIRTVSPGPFNPDGSSQSTTIPAGSTEYSLLNGNLVATTTNPGQAVCPIIVSSARQAQNNLTEQKDEKVMKKMVENADGYLDDHSHVQKNMLYRLFKDNPALWRNDSVLQSFYKTTQLLNSEKFFKVENLIKNNDLILADNLNRSINCSNSVENNYKLFYNLMIRYNSDLTTSADSVALVTLAGKCPFNSGLIVYDARALVNELYGINIFENKNCGGALTYSEKNSDLTEETGFDVVLYPNPTTGLITIEAQGLNSSNTTVIAIDPSGRVIYKNDFYLNNKLEIDLHAGNGLYFLKITDNLSNRSGIKKVVIQK